MIIVASVTVSVSDVTSIQGKVRLGLLGSNELVEVLTAYIDLCILCSILNKELTPSNVLPCLRNDK